MPNDGSVFRILVVDDDPAGANLLQEVMQNLKCRYELHFVWDGVEALQFLHCQGGYADAPRPNLILLDMKMPRLDGLETLTAIKSDTELRVIPVVMLSTSNLPADVRKSYLAHANCYVQKPIDLERAVKLVQAVEAFWIDFALIPGCGGSALNGRQFIDHKWLSLTDEGLRQRENHSGPPIAVPSAEAISRASDTNDSPETLTPTRRSGCEQHNRLVDVFGAAIRELIEMHEQQFLAIVDGDNDCHRFDLLIHMTNEKKQAAKYAYLRHVEEHGCSKLHVTDNA